VKSIPPNVNTRKEMPETPNERRDVRRINGIYRMADEGTQGRRVEIEVEEDEKQSKEEREEQPLTAY